jgi:hypothetical protein
MPRGANPKREREYRELEHKFKKEHRYPGREEEVASRIVNKQRSQYGETKGEKRKDREGRSPDKGLPIPNYQHLTVDQVTNRLDDLSKSELSRVKKYEEQHKHRKTLLEEIDSRRQ